MNPTDVLIVGCGDIGHRVAALEIAAGHSVVGLARGAAREAEFQRSGICPIRGDLDQPDSLQALPRADVLYYLAPPPGTGTGDPRLANCLDALARRSAWPRRWVYISTSGVYGDCAGAWVDEDWPLAAKADRAKRRVAAERLLAERLAATSVDWVILRVPGIYGPGRLPVDRVRQGTPVIREEEAPFSNRIHADDLALACLAAARHGVSGRAYNVSDGCPTTMTDYFCRIARLIGAPEPPRISLAEARQVFSPAMLSFLEESKRLDNRRMREELGVEPRYPDLETGLRSCV